MQLDYTVISPKSYRETVDAVVDATQERGFKVQFVHDVAETLAEKGFDREPVTIIEICNAKYASQVLSRDILIGLMLPCPVMVYELDGVVSISTMKPTLIGAFFPEADLEQIASEVESIIVGIVDSAVA